MSCRGGVIVRTIYHEKEHLEVFICFKRDIVQNYVVSEIQLKNNFEKIFPEKIISLFFFSTSLITLLVII